MCVIAVQFFYDHNGGCELADYFVYTSVNFEKPFFKRVFVAAAEHSGFDERGPPARVAARRARCPDHSVAGSGEAGVDAHDPCVRRAFGPND
jgi:hypothetical protein